jgi:hypothetical protein
MTKILISKVLFREISQPLKMVSTTDFSRSDEKSISISDLQDIGPLSPYAVDTNKKSTLYIAKLNLQEALDSTFYYRYQRENANYLVEIPWSESLQINAKRTFLAPTFIFSTGRCGSTLLTKIYKATNTPSFSEPDFYSQVALTKLVKTDLESKNLLKRINTILTHDLLNSHNVSLTPNVSIKLRAECTRDPSYFLFQRDKKQKTVFMTRHFLQWAKSAYWHFRKINPKLINNLPNFFEQTIRCYRFLNEHTNCELITYENLTGSNSTNIKQLSKLTGKPIDLDTFTKAISTDSQSGSGIESDEYNLEDNEKDLINEAYKKWLELTDHSYLSQTPLAYLLENKASL